MLGVYPFGRWLRSHPPFQLLVWSLIGALPFVYSFDLGIVSDLDWLGDSHGVEVALIDLLALSLFVARPRSTRPLPYRAAMAIYLFAVVVAVVRAPSTMAAFFFVWKLLRMYFLFMVLVRCAQGISVPLAVMRGMMLGTLYEFILVFWQRFSVAQPPGSFIHQNSLGLAVNLALMAPLAMILARRADWLTVVTPVAGLVTIVLTRSRGALIFLILGIALVFFISVLRGLTTRKLVVATLAAVLALAVFAKTAQRISERFENAPAASMEARYQFETAAAAMLRENPLGVGANHFTWAMVNRGYADRAGIMYGNRFAIVHNIYWLTAAEMGYFGLAALLGLFLCPLVQAFRYAFVAGGDVRGDLLLGLGVALLLYYLHGTVEWIGRTTAIAYLFWMEVAMVAALASQLRGLKRRTGRKGPEKASASPRRFQAQTRPYPRPATVPTGG